jgi:outer membrane protein assembly factor BamB
MALLLVGGGAAFYVMSRAPGDVVNDDVEFQSTATATVQAPAAEAGGIKGAFDWPVYGYAKSRTRYLPLKEPLRPPFAERWKLGGSVLLEFPPAMGRRSLFLLKNNAALYGMSRKTGKVRWKRKLGYLAAAAPAYAHGTVYVVLLQRGKGIRAGRVVALRAKDGRTRWSKKLPSRSESSPLIDAGTVYFGSEDGTVYALRARDGFTRWRYRTGGAVKGGLALDSGKLFFGDYAGKVTALRASDGHRVWRTGTSGTRLGLGAGNFYATPAVEFGRVYIGNTDGFVYSFGTRDGRLAWRKKTKGYVYGSAAVAQVPGGRPTVYVGSYDGTFYALDARTGRVRWSRKAEGRISGGAVVLGDLVFYSTLKKTTTALGARTGEKVWSTRRGGFNPVVSNGRGLFLVGFTSLYGLDARPSQSREAAAARVRRRAVGRRVERRRRALAHRVAARRRAVHRRNALRRRGIPVCFKDARGKRTCRRPAPLVCLRRSSDDRTVCRARRRR